jgi:amino acid transporter
MAMTREAAEVEAAGAVEHKRHKVGYLQLTFLIYGAVCGGAFGLEKMIGGTGPGLSILVLALMPFLFSVPLSLAVSELTTTFPVEGGNYRWSRMAFGDFWGFQAGWWAWASGLVTSASFAALFADYMKTWRPDMGAAEHWLICLVLIWVVHYLNVKGIDVVGNSAIIMSVLLLLPFVVLIVLGFAHWNFNPVKPFIAPGKGLADFGVAVYTSIWLYSGYEKLSSAAEEVENPQKIFPPALLSAATLAMLSYVLPTLCALAFLGNWQDWTDSYFSTVASLMGGAWLGQAMAVAGLLSNALLLNVTMLSASRSLYTMSEDRLMPPFLSHVSKRYDTPTWALLAGSVILSVLSLFSFDQLLIIYLWFQMAANMLIYVNVWAMRRTHADAERPYKVPGGTLGLALLAAPTFVLALFGLVSSVFPSWQFDLKQFIIAAVAMLSGVVLYLVAADTRKT